MKPNPTLTFSPPAGVVGETYSVSGAGFVPGRDVTVGATFADKWTYWASGVVDADGRFRFVMAAHTAGVIPHVAKQRTRAGFLREVSSASYTVV